VTVPEIMAVTRLSRSKVYSLIEQELLKSVRLPGVDRVLVAREDLEAFLEAGRERGEAGEGVRQPRCCKDK
jgi:excisionase family DNA binding protein